MTSPANIDLLSFAAGRTKRQPSSTADLQLNSLGIGASNLALTDSSGNLSINSVRLVGVADPLNPQDAVTLNYITSNYLSSSNAGSTYLTQADAASTYLTQADATATYVPLASVGAANGVAALDVSGKVPVAQLPSVVMEFQGSWDPTTNTPPLADGTLYTVTATALSGALTSGATYSDGVTTFTVVQSEASSATTVYVTGSAAPTGGTLTLSTGSGPATIAFSGSTSSTFTNGNTYWVSAASATPVPGLSDASMTNFQIGDLVIFAGNKWELSSPAAGVSAVNGAQGAVTVNAINQLTGDVTTSAASGSQSEASLVAKIQGTTVTGTTGTGKVVFSAAPTVSQSLRIVNVAADTAGVNLKIASGAAVDYSLTLPNAAPSAAKKILWSTDTFGNLAWESTVETAGVSGTNSFLAGVADTSSSYGALLMANSGGTTVSLTTTSQRFYSSFMSQAGNGMTPGMITLHLWAPTGGLSGSLHVKILADNAGTPNTGSVLATYDIDASTLQTTDSIVTANPNAGPSNLTPGLTYYVYFDTTDVTGLGSNVLNIDTGTAGGWTGYTTDPSGTTPTSSLGQAPFGQIAGLGFSQPGTPVTVNLDVNDGTKVAAKFSNNIGGSFTGMSIQMGKVGTITGTTFAMEIWTDAAGLPGTLVAGASASFTDADVIMTGGNIAAVTKSFPGSVSLAVATTYWVVVSITSTTATFDISNKLIVGYGTYINGDVRKGTTAPPPGFGTDVATGKSFVGSITAASGTSSGLVHTVTSAGPTQGKIDQSFLQYNINFGTNRLSGVSDPTLPSDAATKNYVDTAYTAGNGLSLTSRQFSAKTDGTTINTGAAGNALQLMDSSVTTAKIVDGAVTAGKLASSTNLFATGNFVDNEFTTMNQGVNFNQGDTDVLLSSINSKYAAKLVITDPTYVLFVSVVLQRLGTSGNYRLEGHIYPDNAGVPDTSSATTTAINWLDQNNTAFTSTTGYNAFSFNFSTAYPGSPLNAMLAPGTYWFVLSYNTGLTTGITAGNCIDVSVNSTGGDGYQVYNGTSWTATPAGVGFFQTLQDKVTPNAVVLTGANGYLDSSFFNVSMTLQDNNIQAAQFQVIGQPVGSQYYEVPPFTYSDSTGNVLFNVDFMGNLTLGATNAPTPALLWYNMAGAQTGISVSNDPSASGYILTLPPTGGNFGDILSTDGSGTTSWQTPIAARSITYAAGNYAAPVDSTAALNINGGASSKVAFAYVPGSNLSFTQVNLRLFKQGTPAGSIKVQLCADSSGSPGSVIATSIPAFGTSGLSTNPLDGTLCQFFFSTQALTSGTTYWFVVYYATTTGVDTNNYAGVNLATAGTAGATASFNGTTWSSSGSKTVFYGINQSGSNFGEVMESNAASGYLDQSFLQYNINFGGNVLSGLANPVGTQDAATKGYVDGAISAVTLTAGNGISVSGTTISAKVDGTTIDTAAAGNALEVKFSSTGTVYGTGSGIGVFYDNVTLEAVSGKFNGAAAVKRHATFTNATGSAITQGQVVFIRFNSGAAATQVMELASPSSANAPSSLVGIVKDTSIADGANGEIIIVEGYNEIVSTINMTPGALQYLSATTPGALQGDLTGYTTGMHVISVGYATAGGQLVFDSSYVMEY